MSARKIYAKQVAPEHQESPLLYHDFFDYDAEKLSVYGNGYFTEHKTKLFERVDDVLCCGELAYILDGIKDGTEEYYKTATEAIADYLPPDKCRKRYSTREIHKLQKLVLDYAGSYVTMRDCEITCDVLSIVSGERYNYRTIRGCCQSDWNTVFYAVSAWNDEALKNFETEYFNTGSERIIHGELEASEDIT